MEGHLLHPLLVPLDSREARFEGRVASTAGHTPFPAFSISDLLKWRWIYLFFLEC
jgi:hypothetical protein